MHARDRTSFDALGNYAISTQRYQNFFRDENKMGLRVEALQIKYLALLLLALRPGLEPGTYGLTEG